MVQQFTTYDAVDDTCGGPFLDTPLSILPRISACPSFLLSAEQTKALGSLPSTRLFSRLASTLNPPMRSMSAHGQSPLIFINGPHFCRSSSFVQVAKCDIRSLVYGCKILDCLVQLQNPVAGQVPELLKHHSSWGSMPFWSEVDSF